MTMQPPSQYRNLVVEFGQAVRSCNHKHRYDSVRMSIYQELFLNNINTFISSAFPVTKSILNEQQWSLLIQQFLANYECQSPLFTDISFEFLTFVGNENTRLPKHLIELMHYEWLELKLDGESTHINRTAKPQIDSIIAVSPLSHLAIYQYPVHLIQPGFEPYKEMTHLLIYRGWNETICFDLLTASSALLFHKLMTQEGTLEQQLEYLAMQLGTACTESFKQFGFNQVIQWYEAGSVVGISTQAEES